jgi:PAS domain S-box-containing protein
MPPFLTRQTLATGFFMQIYFIVITFLIGLSAYLWRAKNGLSRQLARLVNDVAALKAGRRYKELFENTSDAIFVVEVIRAGVFRFDSLNAEARQVFDRDGIGFEGKRFDEISKRSANAELWRILQELSNHLVCAVASGLPVEYESIFRFADESTLRTYDVNLVPMADDGGIGHIFCFARDVTARKLYEQELLGRVKLEEQLSGFAGSAPGFFYSYRHGADGSNTMPFASAGIDELFGLKPEDVAPSIAPLSMLIHRDDQQMFFAETARSAVDLSPLSVEFRVEHPSKGELWIESRAMPIAEPDGSIVWHGFMHEVTERKRYEQSLLERAELEQRQSHFFSVAPGFFYTSVRQADGHNSMPFASTGIRDLFGLEPADVVRNSAPFLVLIHSDDRELRLRKIEESARNMTRLHYECRFSHPQKGERWLEAHSLPQPIPDGGIRWDGFMHDITDRKLTELKLKETQDKLRELVLSLEAVREEERKRISWEMHEELGQLLAAIKMRMYGMRSQMPKNIPSLDEDNRVIVSLIDKSIKTIHDIVSDLRPTVLLHGIAASLEWVVGEFNRHPDMVCALEIKEDGTHVSEELTTLVFRVVQESLNNIARQTGVSRVVVTWISSRGGHKLLVRHNGETCTSDFVDDKSLSFFGIQERVTAFGGEMQMFSGLQQGLVLEATFPV